MSEQTDQNGQWTAKAQSQDSAERKEDYMVLVIAAVTVALVMVNLVGPNSFKSLFF